MKYSEKELLLFRSKIACFGIDKNQALKGLNEFARNTKEYLIMDFFKCFLTKKEN